MLNGTHKNGNGSSNGVHKDTTIVNGHDSALDGGLALLWDDLPPAVTTALEQPLDSALVSQRKGRGGRTYSYIEGHTVIDQANRIFGYGGWGYELVGDVTLRRIENMDATTGEVKRIHAYSAPVRVTVPGAPPRTDVGFHSVVEETGEGHETACKGAVTDGLKRALRSFGEAFGNGLYGEQPTVEAKGRGTAAGHQHGTDADTSNDNDDTYVMKLRSRLVKLGVEQGFDEQQVRDAVRKQTNRELDDLAAAELTSLVKRAARKVQEMKPA